MQVLQACAVQVIKQSARLREGWTQGFTLRTVCRRALHINDRLTTLERWSSWDRARSDRRFKEALKAQVWTTLPPDVMGRLWQALGRPSAFPTPLACVSVCLLCSEARPKCAPLLPVSCSGSRCPTALCTCAIHQHPTPAAGTPAGACAWRWLQEQGAALTCICGLVVDADAERLRTLLTSLPALGSISRLEEVSGLTLRPRPGAGASATQDFLAGAARAIGCCSCLQRLELRIEFADQLADGVPGSFCQYLAEARALEDLMLTIGSGGAGAHDEVATASVPQMMAGLAGLSRLRTLALKLDNVGGDATLPACVSHLAALTSLTLNGLRGLRCADGWARLPNLQRLVFYECGFAADGEAALPGMGALASLTELEAFLCPGLHVLPASLWRLMRLRNLGHWGLCNEQPAPYLPTSAPCFALLTDVTLNNHQLRDWPACVLGMTNLTHLDQRNNCFEELPDAVSTLTALQMLYLGRRFTESDEIGGALDARALGNLAGFPALGSLEFDHCSVQFCPSFQAAAAHPCLKELELVASYPACGSSCGAFLGFVHALLQQGRAGVLQVHESVVQGAGRHDCRRFRGALQAVGFPLREVASDDADDEL